MPKLIIGALTLAAVLLVSVLSGFAADTPPRIMPDAVKARLDNSQQVIFIDTRNGYAWSSSDKIIPGAIRVRGEQDFVAAQKTLQKDDFIVTYCT